MAEHDERNFGLTEGMRLEVLSEELVFIFNGVLSKIDDNAIWVVSSDGDCVPSVIYNSRIRLKGTLRNGGVIMLFGTICGSGAQFWKVGELSQYRFYNKRNYYRHPVSIETTAARLIYEPLEKEGTDCLSPSHPEPCKVLDISGGGLMFYSDARFSVNTDVQMGEFTLLPNSASFSLRCRVLRVTDRNKRYFYGCQFIDLEAKEQERLIRDIFLLQIAAIKRRNRM